MLDKKKALNAILYVSGKLKPEECGLHKIFKILWFAEIAHMREYGRFITGDSYVKMEHGPVPSYLYDVLKGIRDSKPEYEEYRRIFSVVGHAVKPLLEPDLDYLSESDIEQLDKSIDDNRKLSFGQIADKSHGKAWSKSIDNDFISLEDILEEIQMDSEERSLILENHEFLNAISAARAYA